MSIEVIEGSRSDRRPVQDPVALITREAWFSRSDLQKCVDERVRVLANHMVCRLATLGDNGREWVVTDLAARQAGIVHVPLPGFFTPQQRRNVVEAAGVDAVFVDSGQFSPDEWPDFQPIYASAAGWHLMQRQVRASSLPDGTAKVTFTSGSTGNPKGVCLSAQGLSEVAAGVARVTFSLGLKRHLNALPYAVLLENVAGLYAAMEQSATNVSLPLSAVGLHGASRFDPARFHQTLVDWSVDSVILLPQMLKAYVQWLSGTRTRAPASLVYVAVGGAPLGAKWLVRARQVGVPAFQGYGLSEGGSVQTVNLPGSDRPESVGRLLPHTRMRFAPDGEIVLGSPGFLGYVGQTQREQEWFPTGDLGYLDDEGFLHLAGRKSNRLITGYGRNVSPEWVEACLMDQASVAVAVVLGDGQCELGAVIWPAGKDISDQVISNAVAAANSALPDYARVGKWVRARHTFSLEQGVSTANGRPVRAAVEQHYFSDLFHVVGQVDSVLENS